MCLRGRRSGLVVVLAAVLAAGAACGPGGTENPSGGARTVGDGRAADGPAANAPQDAPASPFDSARAWRDLKAQVALGPRHSGSPANARLRAWLEDELTAAGLRVVREPFRDQTPIGELAFENLYADLPGAPAADGSPAPLVVLASHFDTKRMRFAFEGANDGASSTAVLLELARVLAAEERPRPVTYRFLFFDGEEAVREVWQDPDNTYGSRAHVAGLRERGELASIRACVLLDMVGDAELRLTTDLASDARLLELFFAAAREVGLGAHVGARRQDLRDDHIPFRAAGIPACDLIDFEYGPYNDYWHSSNDTVANCSQESLDIIGRIVLAGLPQLEAFALAGR